MGDALHTCRLLSNINQSSYNAETGQHSPLQGSCCLCVITTICQPASKTLDEMCVTEHPYTVQLAIIMDMSIGAAHECHVPVCFCLAPGVMYILVWYFLQSNEEEEGVNPRLIAGWPV